MPEPQTLPQLVRKKYPGVYDDLSDFELDQKVRAKYPGVYDDLPTPAAKPDPRAPSMGPAVRGTALPADTQFSGFGTALQGGPQGTLETALHTPLGHPTGVEAIDDLTTPANLILLGTQIVPRAGRYALTKLHKLLQSTPEIASDVLGLISPRSAHALRVAQRVSDAAAKGQGISAADEALLLKQGLSRQAIAKLRAQMAEQAATSPGGASAAAPAAAAPATVPPPAPSPRPSAGSPAVPPPAAPSASQTAGAPPATVNVLKGETLNLPASQRTAGQMSDQWIANDIAVAARRARVALSPKEAETAARLVKAGGASPLEAVQSSQRIRPPAAPGKPKLTAAETAVAQKLMAAGKTPAQALEAVEAMRALGAGLPSSRAVDAAVKARNATGRWPQ